MAACVYCSVYWLQLEEKRAALADATLTERTAKAVLVAATAAARRGRLLSSAERADAERSVSEPDAWAADQETARRERAKACLQHCRKRQLWLCPQRAVQSCAWLLPC